jgi:hypothetical protein
MTCKSEPAHVVDFEVSRDTTRTAGTSGNHEGEGNTSATDLGRQLLALFISPARDVRYCWVRGRVAEADKPRAFEDSGPATLAASALGSFLLRAQDRKQFKPGNVEMFLFE